MAGSKTVDAPPLEVGTDALVSGDVALGTMDGFPYAMVLSDPTLDDNPLVYVNDAFERTTGYKRDEVLGRNCRFLQGSGTDPGVLRDIRDAVAEAKPLTVTLRNERADGSAFMNRLAITPILGTNGSPRYFLGVQIPVQEIAAVEPDVDAKLSEVQHRVKNHLAMVVGLIRAEGRKKTTGVPEAQPDMRLNTRERFDALSLRVEALQLVYEELNEAAKAHDGDGTTISLSAYLTRIAVAVGEIVDLPGIRIRTDMDHCIARLEPATQLGLIVSELLTNAVRHAFEGREEGLIGVQLRAVGDTVTLKVVDNGNGMKPGTDWPNGNGMGSRIVLGLIDGLDAKPDVRSDRSGTTITIAVPGPNILA